MTESENGEIEAGVDRALEAWRQKATEIVLTVAAIAHLPACSLVLLNLGPKVTPMAKAAAVVAYLAILPCAVLRRLDYRKRLAALMTVAYLFVATVCIAVPRGPWAQLGPVALPLVTLVLAGARWGRITAAISGAILISAPLVRPLPWVASVFVAEPAQMAMPLNQAWTQAVVQGGLLIGVMILLEQLHAFLLEGLARQQRAKTELELEAARRQAAQSRMEEETRKRQRLEREIAGIGDRERQRLGHELHDGVCQQATAALLRCQALERRVAQGATVSAEDFHPLSLLLGEVIDDTRGVAMGLCPLESDAEALTPALRALTKQMEKMAGIHCEFLVRGDVRVPDSGRAHHLYRIAQEALSNAARHASPSRILVELRGSGNELLLQVEDNGAGLQAGRTPGMGMRTMAYRAQMLGGELKVAPASGGGTRVSCLVPRVAAENGDRPEQADSLWSPV